MFLRIVHNSIGLSPGSLKSRKLPACAVICQSTCLIRKSWPWKARARNRIGQRHYRPCAAFVTASPLYLDIMENPRKEIAGVVKGLCSAKNADEQRDTMQRYFVSDASFDHPMCAVMSYENVSLHPLTDAVARHGRAPHLPMAACHVYGYFD